MADSIFFFSSEGSNGSKSQYFFLGDTNPAYEKIREEYIRYVSSPHESSSSPFRPEALAEFKESIHALSLNADDVDGIREVSYSNSCGFVVRVSLSQSRAFLVAC